MTPLEIVLHRDAILAQIAFLTAFQKQLESVQRGSSLFPEIDVPQRMATIFEDQLKPPGKKIIPKGL